MSFTVHTDAETLRDELDGLFATSTGFGDPDLQGANKCLLAAACGQVGDLSSHAHLLRTASSEVAQALVGLVHGQRVILRNDTGQFFDLFKLVKRMNIWSCMELCQEVVNNAGYSSETVKLQLSVGQAEGIRAQLCQWQTSPVQEWTDVSMLVRGDGGTSMRAHLIILVAHCDYFRALWAGNFKENVATAEVILQDSVEAQSANMLLQILYGNTVQINSEEELVRLCCLADKWQCSSVRSATLQAIDTQNAMVATVAVDILGWEPPAPAVLTQAAIRAIQRSQDEGDLTIQNMPILPVCRLLKSMEMPCYGHEDEKTCSVYEDEGAYYFWHGDEIEALQARALFCLCNEDVPKLVLRQIPTMTLLELLQCDSTRHCNFQDTFPRNLASWAIELETSVASANTGDAPIHIAKLLWKDAPAAIRTALRDAIVQSIVEYAEDAPCIMCDLLRGASSVSANIHSSSPLVNSNHTEPHAKRQKLIHRKLGDIKWLLLNLEAHVLGLILESALAWAARYPLPVVQCRSWIELEAKVFVHLSAALLENVVQTEDTDPCLRAEEVRMRIIAWINEAPVPAVIEALRVAGSTSNPRMQMLFHLLLDHTHARWTESEHQNVVLQGGQHKKELAAAVLVAQRETESKLRVEFEHSTASLRQSMIEEHQQRLNEVDAMHHNRIVNIQKRVLAIFADEPQPKALKAGA